MLLKIISLDASFYVVSNDVLKISRKNLGQKLFKINKKSHSHHLISPKLTLESIKIISIDAEFDVQLDAILVYRRKNLF